MPLLTRGGEWCFISDTPVGFLPFPADRVVVKYRRQGSRGFTFLRRISKLRLCPHRLSVTERRLLLSGPVPSARNRCGLGSLSRPPQTMTSVSTSASRADTPKSGRSNIVEGPFLDSSRAGGLSQLRGDVAPGRPLSAIGRQVTNQYWYVGERLERHDIGNEKADAAGPAPVRPERGVHFHLPIIFPILFSGKISRRLVRINH